jgi:hypothetical protein
VVVTTVYCYYHHFRNSNHRQRHLEQQVQRKQTDAQEATMMPYTGPSKFMLSCMQQPTEFMQLKYHQAKQPALPSHTEFWFTVKGHAEYPDPAHKEDPDPDLQEVAPTNARSESRPARGTQLTMSNPGTNDTNDIIHRAEGDDGVASRAPEEESADASNMSVEVDLLP